MKIRVKMHHANGQTYQIEVRGNGRIADNRTIPLAISNFTLRAGSMGIDVLEAENWTVMVYRTHRPVVYLLDTDLNVTETIK